MTAVGQEKFITTREASKLLGVALATVQSWVESGVLPAWKTAGGHRRIPLLAVEELLLQQKSAILESKGAKARESKLKVLVVEDAQPLLKLYQLYFSKWQLPVELLLAENGFAGLLMIGEHNPDLLITDLAMPGMDGYQMINHLVSQGNLGAMRIVVVTGKSAEDIEADGGLPDTIAVYHKPIPFEELHGEIVQLLELRKAGK